jgi:pyrroloquinoline quinone biosynthesis protein B
MKGLISLLCGMLLLISWGQQSSSEDSESSAAEKATIEDISIIVLGTAQDAGMPHIGCNREDCQALFNNSEKPPKVVSLGIIDPASKQNWLFEATPDLPSQMNALKNYSPFEAGETPDGIFLTHAHIGHYTGLMYLGREALGADGVPVYALPRMKTFLESNGPWDQLVRLNNIILKPLQADQKVNLSPGLGVTPFPVPHRDEYSETAGYLIEGPNKKALFIPDIDKWEKWSKSIIEMLEDVDYAFLDATFYDAQEVNNRDISEIPHPFIIESMELFKDLSPAEKSKIHFIHYNHSNPAIHPESKQSAIILENGFKLARSYQTFKL